MPETMPKQLHTYGHSRYMQTADGRRLHYMEQGAGTLTVVFESGMGASRSVWGLVQPHVAEHTRAVVYDRAGMGRSEPDREPRTLARIAGDLSQLLDHLGPGPFVLVGHSWGGPIIRTAAAMNTGRLRGLVLVDPTDEHCGMYFEESSAKHYGRMDTILPLMTRTGLYRLLGSRPGKVQPADVYKEHRREDFTMQSARTMLAEGQAFVEDLRTLRGSPLNLGDTEVCIVSGTLMSGSEKNYRPALHAAHRQSAALLETSRLVEAPKSGHMIMYSEPQLIVNEIIRMLV
ncbi:alpha/beta fold hydrolase [Paenibacillus tepidiphilus]|uniref:alpha/beta fold hydrolase n=1 Tax=Paenibacillus tepidiphilus TaxID=2608683 RepID=UPI001EF01E21|nr:alpha/beta hydrolase [Paenibacillus tepidiphilus]